MSHAGMARPEQLCWQFCWSVAGDIRWVGGSGSAALSDPLPMLGQGRDGQQPLPHLAAASHSVITGNSNSLTPGPAFWSLVVPAQPCQGLPTTPSRYFSEMFGCGRVLPSPSSDRWTWLCSWRGLPTPVMLTHRTDFLCWGKVTRVIPAACQGQFPVLIPSTPHPTSARSRGHSQVAILCPDTCGQECRERWTCLGVPVPGEGRTGSSCSQRDGHRDTALLCVCGVCWPGVHHVSAHVLKEEQNSLEGWHCVSGRSGGSHANMLPPEPVEDACFLVCGF